MIINILVSPTANGYIVKESYTFCKVTVPAGYETNGADIPRILWSLFPPFKPKYLPAIILHDYLCDIANSNKLAYKLADEKLKEGMQLLGTNKFTQSCFYLSCRLYHKIKYRKLKDVVKNS